VTLTTETFDGLPGGMNLALPAQELDDTEARYLQDVLVDQPGLTRRRGPVTPVTGVAALTRKGSGLVSALNPQGSARFSVLNGDNSTGFLTVYDSTLASIVDLAWPHSLPTSPGTGNSYKIVDSKPALRGGAWIGVSSTYDAASPSQALGLWFGGTKANATITVTATRGSQTVTGTGFNAGVDPGMFLFSDTDDPYSQAYVGTVKSVESNTSLTLIAASPYAISAKSGTFQSLRGFAPKVAKGRITTDTASTTVTGGATKFRSQKVDTGTVLTGTTTNASAVITGLSSTGGLTKGMPVTGTGIGAGARILTIDSSTQVTLTVNSTASASVSITFKVPWDIYRASDGVWVGTVLSVQSEISLTLLANAAISMSDEAYVAVRADANFSLITTGTTQKGGFITMNYADRQWYFNNGADFAKTSRGWFSDTADPEIVDMSDFDGDWIDIVSTSNVNEPVRGAQAAYNGGLIFKETETFLISGSSPTSFTVRKLEDDGAISGGSIQPYAGGVIWAGREGIHFYDGIQAQNLASAKLGDYYRNTMRTFDPTKYRMWSAIDRDHYMLFVENISPTVPVVKGNVSTTPTKYTFVVNMVSRAITTFVGVDMRGAVTLPGSTGRAAWFLVNSTLVIPTAGAATFAGGGGTLTPGTYYYKVSALNSIGETVGAVEVSAIVTTLGDRPVITWSAIAGATSYRVYRGTAPGAENVFYTVAAATNPSFTDTGAANTSGSPRTTSSVDIAVICDGEALFNQEGVDTIVNDGSTAPGPDFYIESKKYDAGDGLRLKRFRQLAVWYLAQGDAMKVDVVLGLNNIGQTLTGTFPVSGFTWDTLRSQIATWDALKAQFATWNDIVKSVFVPKRVRFQKKNQYFAFRLYQTSSAVTRMQMGPFQLGYKEQRPGRL
jgi:hypothetical protein